MEELQALLDRLLAGTATAQDTQAAWLSFEVRRTAALEGRVAKEIEHMAWMQAQSERQTIALEAIAVALLATP